MSLADKHRPDRNPGDPVAAAAFAESYLAYETLTDRVRRAEYDRGLLESTAIPSDGVVRRYPIQFSASAGEYFRIWIVNLALTVLTLGIYSAWAKVRKKRYFYGHTKIDGVGFEYRAAPMGILKGRLIAFAALAAYAVSGEISSWLEAAFVIGFVFALPWFLVRSLAFNAYNSTYRNVCFQFRGKYSDALKLVLVGGFLLIVTLGLAFPYVRARFARFAASGHQYGTAQFELPSLARAFYAIYGRWLGMVLVLILVPALFGVLAGVSSKAGWPSGMMLAVGIVAGSIVVYAYIVLWLGYLKSRTTNLVWNHLAIGQTQPRMPASSPGHGAHAVPDARVRFESRLRARELAQLYLVNAAAIVVTLGLAIPWAVVRSARYRIQSLSLLVAGDLDEIAAAEASSVGATGDEVGELAGFDFGF